MKSLELTGLRFGKLTVLSKTGRQANSVMWLCRCDCGNQKSVRGGHLSRGSVASCGCEQGSGSRKRHRPHRLRSFLREVERGYRQGAKIRGLEWSLSEDLVHEILLRPCFYCGDAGKQRRRKWPEFQCNGIDRVDNRKGYEYQNVVACCESCNLSKNDRSCKDFLDWVEKVFRRSCAANV